MSDVIPASTRLAAKRGFVRTTCQAYAATLSAGVPTAATLVAILQDPTGWLLAGVTLGLALVSPVAAGLASYASITSNGIPEAYQGTADTGGV